MKKLFVAILIVIIAAAAVFTFAACNNEKGSIKIIVPDGAPALAIAKMLKDKPQFDKYEITYEIVPGAAEISAKIANGEADFAIAPTNIAANIYNKGTDIRIISANTFGNLYLVGTESVSDLSDLKGEVVYNIGMGGTPDLTFKYILNQMGIEYFASDVADETGAKVALHYVSSGAELIPLLKTGNAKFGILGEPAVSQALKNVSGSIRLFAIHYLWAVVTEGLDYTQAVFVGRKDAIDKYEGIVEWLSDLLDENVDWIAANPAEAQAALADAGSTLTVALNKQIIRACNIGFVPAKYAKSDINAYLTAMASFNAAAIGGKMPEDTIYYQ